MLVRALRLVPEWLSRRTGAEVLSSSSHPTKRAPMRLWSSQSGGQQQSLSLERVAELIAAPEARVIVMAGAGVSVSAGIDLHKDLSNFAQAGTVQDCLGLFYGRCGTVKKVTLKEFMRSY